MSAAIIAVVSTLAGVCLGVLLASRNSKKALCCSKKILVASYTVTAVLTAAAVWGVFFTQRDMTVMGVICGLAWGESGLATGFYYWKARHENRVKLTLSMVEKLADKYGIEAVVSLAGHIFNDMH